MSVYTLILTSLNGNALSLELHNKTSDNIINDYKDTFCKESVYGDHSYYIKMFDSSNTQVQFESAYINYEIIQDRNVCRGLKPDAIFKDCFGIIKIEVVYDGCSYVTSNISVKIKKSNINDSIKNMIDYIYENCDEYLYEKHEYSKTVVGIRPNANISLDSRLSMLEDIEKIYNKYFSFFKFSAQSKLINAQSVDDFSKLKTVNSNTIRYISIHPEELQPVNYNSGIIVNHQYFQPNNTLIQSIAYSYDTYENQIIVSFLKTVINELSVMRKRIEATIAQNSVLQADGEYVDSSYYIYTRNNKLLKEYIEAIGLLEKSFANLYLNYKRILRVQDVNVNAPPRYTDVFRKIIPYNAILKEILKWFSCGNYDLAKSDLLLTFVSLSKIYEYYCLININKAFERNGFRLSNAESFSYEELSYYCNVMYNNTFEYYKDSLTATVYFQPVIYNGEKKHTKNNGIKLFRNTSLCISNPDVLAALDDKPEIRSKDPFYTPDYIIRIQRDQESYYYILDAKHSTSNNVKKYQMPPLIFKYLFSISPTSNDSILSGLYVLCGKENFNSFENIYDIAEKSSYKISPEVAIIGLTGIDLNNTICMDKLITQITSL